MPTTQQKLMVRTGPQKVTKLTKPKNARIYSCNIHRGHNCYRSKL